MFQLFTQISRLKENEKIEGENPYTYILSIGQNS